MPQANKRSVSWADSCLKGVIRTAELKRRHANNNCEAQKCIHSYMCIVLNVQLQSHVPKHLMKTLSILRLALQYTILSDFRPNCPTHFRLFGTLRLQWRLQFRVSAHNSTLKHLFLTSSYKKKKCATQPVDIVDSAS